MKQSVLLLGGCGYVGSALSLHLTRQGHRVTSVDLLKRPYPAGAPGHTNNYAYDYRMAPVDVLHASDTVIHLAGATSFAQAAVDPYGAFKANLSGLIDVARKMLPRQRLFYASSASVMSNSSQTNMYDMTKKAAEAMLPLIRDNTVALRFGTVCGASPNTRTDLIINRMTMDACATGKITMANPHVRRAVLGIGDLCVTVEKLVNAHATLNPVVRLCSFEYSVGQIADQVQSALRANDIEHEMTIAEPTPSYDVTMPASPIFGWVPQDTVASLVAGLIEQHKATTGGLGAFK